MTLAFAPAEFDVLQDVVERLRPDYSAIADYLVELARDGVWKDVGSSALLCGYRPDLGSKAFDITLFPPVPPGLIERFEKQTGRALPMSLRHLYLRANGCFLGRLNIYGIISSFGREKRAPFDLAMGDVWRVSYASCDDEALLFASKNVSDSGQIGYFISPDGRVFGRGNGELHAPDDSGTWMSLAFWLQDQLPTIS